MKKKEYVQFSKRMVLFVCIAVTSLSVIAMVMCCAGDWLEGLGEILKGDTGFATVCFAAYSGNSMVEKWLVRRFDMHGGEEEKEDEG